MNEYRYLIGFASGRGFGTIDIARPTPITSTEDAQQVQRELRKHLADPDALMLSFSHYADPAPDGR